MPRCFIALGGNLGPIERTFGQALKELDSLPRVELRAASSTARYPAIGAHAGGAFHNGVASVTTDLEPLALLDQMQAIEARLGRTRHQHWGPRTLDLDLILYGELVIDVPQLRVPHPACWYRRFVLDPLTEIAADVIHPEKEMSFGALRRRLLIRPFRVELAGATETVRKNVIASLKPRWPDVEFTHFAAAGPQTSPTLLAWLGAADLSDNTAGTFDTLPGVPRLDLSASADVVSKLHDVIQSAVTGSC